MAGELTKQFEGFVPTIYKDTKGKRTEVIKNSKLNPSWNEVMQAKIK